MSIFELIFMFIFEKWKKKENEAKMANVNNPIIT